MYIYIIFIHFFCNKRFEFNEFDVNIVVPKFFNLTNFMSIDVNIVVPKLLTAVE